MTKTLPSLVVGGILCHVVGFMHMFSYGLYNRADHFLFLPGMTFLFIALWASGSWRQAKGCVGVQVMKLAAQRTACSQAAQEQKIPLWRWYGLLWAGFLGFALSIPLAAWNQLPWITSLGVLFWCVTLKWQTMREQRRCTAVMTIDPHFINRKLVLVLLLYLIPIHIFQQAGRSWSPGAQDSFALFITLLYAMTIFPTFTHLLLGQRTPLPGQRWFHLFDMYGFFGNYRAAQPLYIPPNPRRQPVWLMLPPLILLGMVLILRWCGYLTFAHS